MARSTRITATSADAAAHFVWQHDRPHVWDGLCCYDRSLAATDRSMHHNRRMKSIPLLSCGESATTSACRSDAGVKRSCARRTKSFARISCGGVSGSRSHILHPCSWTMAASSLTEQPQLSRPCGQYSKMILIFGLRRRIDRMPRKTLTSEPCVSINATSTRRFHQSSRSTALTLTGVVSPVISRTATL